MDIDFKLSPETAALFAVPALPLIPAESAAEFFANAPVSTVVEIYGDLYKRTPSGDWLHLEDLTSSGGYYSSMEYERSTPEAMMRQVFGPYANGRVLRLGETPTPAEPR